jgi:uncharacterized protein YndB with AHSA1/START domain
MAITQRASGPETLLIEADFAVCDPATLFRYWTEPDLLVRWWSWPQQVEIEPRLNGSYHLGAPQKNWHLRGHYTAFDAPNLLAFTWRWDHDSLTSATREVRITFEPRAAGGTRLLLSHGPYEDTPEEQRVRIDDHLAGWSYFLPRLQKLFE